jgi:hypothetical protein
MQTEFMTTEGDEEAEDRVTARIVAEHRADKAAGRAVLLPDWLTYAIVDGVAPLTAIRKNRGETQAQLAEQTGLPQSYISEIENGTKRASAAAIEKLALCLDCDPAWLRVED